MAGTAVELATACLARRGLSADRHRLGPARGAGSGQVHPGRSHAPVRPRNSFAGESIYKVWSQELFPTLLRATAGGLTTAFARGLAGLVALGTPTFALGLALGHARLFLGLLLGFTVVAGVTGLVRVPRLPKALLFCGSRS